MTYYLATSNITARISGVIWQEWPRTQRPRNGGRLWNPSSGRCQRAKLANGGQKWRRFFTWTEPLALDLWAKAGCLRANGGWNDLHQGPECCAGSLDRGMSCSLL